MRASSGKLNGERSLRLSALALGLEGLPGGVPTRYRVPGWPDVRRCRVGSRWRVLNPHVAPVPIQGRVLDRRQSLAPQLAGVLPRVLTRDRVVGGRQALGPPHVNQRGLLPRRLLLRPALRLSSERIRRRGQSQLVARGARSEVDGDRG